MSTCNRLDLQTLGSQPVVPKNLSDHWFTGVWFLTLTLSDPMHRHHGGQQDHADERARSLRWMPFDRSIPLSESS